MKKINYYSGILSLAVVCLFSSCSTTKYGAHFQPSSNGHSNYATSEKAEKSATALEDENIAVALEDAEKRTGAEDVSSDVMPKAKSLKALPAEVKVDENELTERQEQILAETRERLENMTRKEKRQLRKEIRKINLAEYTKDLPVYDNMDVTQDRGGAVNILALVLAILIPPLGVFIHQGTINSKFWISLILTLLFFVPGMIYSILVVLGVV